MMEVNMVSGSTGKSTRIKKVFSGTIVHSFGQHDPLVMEESKTIGIGSDGKIVFIEDSKELDVLSEKFEFSLEKVRHLSNREFLMPGMVDTHIHAPQYENCGTGTDLALLGWLEKYTFPTEMKFNDTKYASYIYQKVVSRLLRNGTTTASYYGSIHYNSCITLCDIVELFGQRAHIGKTCMDRNSPEYYIEDTQQSLLDTEKFVLSVLNNYKGSLITPVITPRYVPSCSKELMNGLGEIAAKYNIPIQSHLNENMDEIAWVKELHPECMHYSCVYYCSKLLNNKTYMAHCIHLDDSELEFMQRNNTGISHCPNSNSALKSGQADVRRLLNRNLKVGLGTDCSGGPALSMLESMRSAISTSSSLAMTTYKHQNYLALDFKDVFYLATLGGSEVLGLEDRIGNFQVGKEFDALLIDTSADNSAFDTFDKDSGMDMVQKFMMLGDDRNIKDVYVSGRNVCHNGNLDISVAA